jgi:hypothetical protein
MKRHFAFLFVVLLSSLPLAALQQSDPQDQPQQQQDQQQNQQQDQKQEEKRPTLGPPPAPTPGPGLEPTTDYVLDAARLMHVRKIYVEEIDNQLSAKLIEGLAKSGRFRIVLDKKEADAVIRGSCLDARHLRTVHSEVYLSDRVTGKSIWQDNVHVPYNPPPLAKAVDKTADEILRHLANAVLHPRTR